MPILSPFLERLRQGPILCDGGMGTELYARLEAGVDLLILETISDLAEMREVLSSAVLLLLQHLTSPSTWSACILRSRPVLSSL